MSIGPLCSIGFLPRRRCGRCGASVVTAPDPSQSRGISNVAEQNPEKSQASAHQGRCEKANAGREIQARSSLSGTKQETVLALLAQPTGATIAAVTKATGWQQHSVRGFLAGVVRKRLKLKLGSTKVDGVRVYRIASGEAGKSKPREAEQQPH